MIQCDKLLGLGLAERRDVLEKSGLCTFCLKHSAEFECYGKRGLSKPRCTRNGCDGEHTPNVHMLLGEDDAKVNFIAGVEGEEEYETVYEAGDGHRDECEYEWEYEDGGLWVGTVGAVEMLEWGGKASGTTDAMASVLNGSHLDEVRDNDQAKREGNFFRSTETRRKSPLGTDGGTWRRDAPASRTQRSIPCGPGLPTALPTGHRDPATQLRPGSRGPERSRKSLQTSSGKKPGRMPGSGKC
jgi:hypothetical protein